MSKQAKYSYNQRVEFMDNERLHHVGFIKAIHKVGLIRKKIWYDIAELTKKENKQVFFVKEDWIFGLMEFKKEKPISKEGNNNYKVYKDFKELKELIK